MFGLFNKTTDPVCKMKINKKEARLDSARQAKFSLSQNGNTYYFCSENCKGKFTSNPEKYIQSGGDSCCH